MLKYTEYKNREEWLVGRRKTLGASEVSAALGESSFMSPQQLWDAKVYGEKTEEAQSEVIAYGTDAESYLRGLYALKHKKELVVEYHPYRIYTNTDYPHLSCTLDGELLGIGGVYDGRHGLWECKTALIMSARQAAEWEGEHIPQKYYLQVLSQLLITGFDFAILNAELRHSNNNAEIREYRIDRYEVSDDMEYVASETKKFWQYVVDKKRPSTIISI